MLEFVWWSCLIRLGDSALRFSHVDGVLVEPLGEYWMAFSPLTGETTLLNDETAAILEVLGDLPADAESICSALSEDSGMPVDELISITEQHWQVLIEAGLIRSVDDPGPVSV